MTECTVVSYLRQLASSHQDTAIAEAAGSALRMIPDIDSPSTDLSGVTLLNTLVSAIYRANDTSLLVDLLQGAADCEMCDAMQKELSSRESH